MAFSKRERPTFREMTRTCEAPAGQPPPRDIPAGRFGLVIVNGQLRLVCPECHFPVEAGASLGDAWRRAKTHVAEDHGGFQ